MKHLYLTVSMMMTLGQSGYITASEKQKLAQQPSISSGESIYMQSCIACHGADGAGMMPGIPDLTEKTEILDPTNDLLIKRMMEGFQDPGSPIAMPAKGGNPNLGDKDMRAVLEYMHKAFN